jgi:hypothetical protein
MTDLNLAGESYAHSLIAAGRVDKTAPWSFEAADGNALLGKDGNDWDSYGKAHLGLDRSANEKTKARFKYPFAKAGKLYRSGLIAAKQRAGQQGDTAIENAAGALIDVIDRPKSALFMPERKSFTFEYKFLGEGAAPGTFEGYASVYNNEDDGGDKILPGAFASVLARHKANNTMPKMLLNHGSMGASLFGGNDPMADLPIGVWQDMSEDTHGLQSKGRVINLDTERGKNIYGAMKEGALDGQSIGYSVDSAGVTRGTKPNEPRRTIKTIKSLPEVSLVTFPMNELARTGAVKMTEREFERLLTRDAGLSRSEALVVINQGFKTLLATRDAGGCGVDDVLEQIRSARAAFTS